MATVIVYHDVKDGDHWAKAWIKSPGSRHEMFAQIGVKARTFRDEQNPNTTGLILDIPDMEKFQTFMASDEAKQAMKEDGLDVKSLHTLKEFTS